MLIMLTSVSFTFIPNVFYKDNKEYYICSLGEYDATNVISIIIKAAENQSKSVDIIKPKGLNDGKQCMSTSVRYIRFDEGLFTYYMSSLQMS